MMDDRDLFKQAESVLVTASLLWLCVALIAAAIAWRWFV